MMTVEIADSFTELRFSPQGIAFLTDAIIIQRYVEIDGQLRRAMAVVKVRASQHSKELREYEISSDGGIVVGRALKGYEGLLTGTPADGRVIERKESPGSSWTTRRSPAWPRSGSRPTCSAFPRSRPSVPRPSRSTRRPDRCWNLSCADRRAMRSKRRGRGIGDVVLRHPNRWRPVVRPCARGCRPGRPALRGLLRHQDGARSRRMRPVARARTCSTRRSDVDRCSRARRERQEARTSRARRSNADHRQRSDERVHADTLIVDQREANAADGQRNDSGARTGGRG